MHHPLTCLLAAALLLAAAGAATAADGDAGTAGATFLKLNPFPTAGAMGAYTALATGNEALQMSPAGLPAAKSIEFSMMHNDWLGLADHEHFALTLPVTVGEGGALGLSLSYLSTGDIRRTTVGDPNGLSSGNFSASDLMFSAGYGQRLTPQFAVGGTVRFLRERIWTHHANAVAFDAGIRFSQGDEGFSAAAAVLNAGSGLKFVSTEADLPTLYSVGLAYRWKFWETSRLTVAVDGYQPTDEDAFGAVGLEVEAGDYAVARAGYSTRHDEGTGFTCGFGLRDGENWFVDYAYTPQDDLGNANRISLTFRY